AAERLDRDGLAVERVELRLVVEGVDLRGAAVHEQKDDGLRLGVEVRLLRHEGVDELRLRLGGGGTLAREEVVAEQAAQRHGAEASARLPEELAPGAPAKLPECRRAVNHVATPFRRRSVEGRAGN